MKYKKKNTKEKSESVTVPKLFKTPEFQNGMFFFTLIQFIHELAPRSLWFLIDTVTAYREPYQTVSTVYFIIVVLRARVEVGSQKPEVGRPFSAFVVSSCIWVKVQINVQTTQHFQFNSLESRAQFEILWWFDVTSKTKQTVQET